MERVRKPRLAAPLLLLATTIASSAAFGTWLPLLASAPWIVGVAMFGSRDRGATRELPSLAETARERLWAR